MFLPNELYPALTALCQTLVNQSMFVRKVTERSSLTGLVPGIPVRQCKVTILALKSKAGRHVEQTPLKRGGSRSAPNMGIQPKLCSL